VFATERGRVRQKKLERFWKLDLGISTSDSQFHGKSILHSKDDAEVDRSSSLISLNSKVFATERGKVRQKKSRKRFWKVDLGISNSDSQFHGSLQVKSR